MTEKVTLIYSYEDYAPVAVHSSVRGIVFAGDQSHESGYKDFADGYVTALDLELDSIYIENMYDVIDNEDFLKEIGVYSQYEEYFDGMY